MGKPGGGLRAMARDLAHGPFKGDIWQRMFDLYNVGTDVNIEKINQAMRNHLCLYAGPDALAVLGDERHIRRGLTESAVSYAKRNQHALPDLGVAGSAWAILSQVLGYLLTKTPRALTVHSHYNTATGACVDSSWDIYDPGDSTIAPPEHVADLVGNWDWDSHSPTSGSWGWWRWYLVISAVAPNDWIGPRGKMGASGLKMGASGKAIGVNLAKEVCLSIRLIVAQFKANWSDWIIITFDDSLFLPTSPVNAGVNPDGYFGHWSKLVGGGFVPARYSNARYFQGPQT